MKKIADTGLIVALLDRDDPAHPWAVNAFRRSSPFYICEAVLAEAASFFRTPERVLLLLERGDLILDPGFSIANELSAIGPLVSKYADRPMDLADACIVRMSELEEDCRVWTVDVSDFSTYRRHSKRRIPLDLPPSE